MNKLGISDEKLEVVQRKLINCKLNLIDEEFTFNKEKMDAEYLLRLNEFLFGDFYDDIGYRGPEYRSMADSYLYAINEFCADKDIENMKERLYGLWSYQPLKDGNTRTFIALLKILNEGYNLGLDVDVNEEISTDLFNGKRK